VLSVAKVRRGREAYYLEATEGSSPDRPGLVEADGIWRGRLAATLGLADRTVEAASLSLLLAGVDPTTRAPLDPRHARVSVAAFDCTFAAPKSVSVLHALGPADVVEEVRSSHERAVAGALGYLERHAAHVRRAGVVVPAEGFAAASFLHRTSRADDPHLHSHLVVANLASDATARWSAIDARPLFAHASAAGALYRAQLRYEISRRLSVAWQTRAEGFADLIGIPAAALRGFSRRSAEIAAELARTGWAGSRSTRVAAERTRPDKDLGVDYPALVAAWRERAFSLGVARTTVARLGVRTTPERDAVVPSGPVLAARVADSAASLGRSFDRRELIRATCARLDDGAPVARVEAAVDAHLGSGELVRCGERALHLHATGGGRIPGGLVEAQFATREVAALTERLRTALDGAPVLDVLVGGLGFLAGERLTSPGVFVTNQARDPMPTYAAVRAAALAAHADGRRVVGLAPDVRAAAQLEVATGISTAPFEEREALRDGSLVVLAHPDRCALRAIVPLVDGARADGVTVVVLGGAHGAGRAPGLDERDFPAVPAGGARHDAALARHNVAGVEVVLATDFAAALGAIRLLGDENRAKGHRSAVVAVAPRDLAALGVEVVRPHEALRRSRAENLDLIVFGGARILGPGITRVPDVGRAHVALAPVDAVPGGQRSFALELAEPAGLRRELGRSPDGRRARAAWRVRAVDVERRIRLRGVEPGHAHAELARAWGARDFERSRRREPSLSR
jgi:conjugative relaxase-like TrwC/TraI family protein